MKIPFPVITLTAVVCLSLCNCAQTLQDRIEKNPAIYAALSGAQKEAVGQGRLLEGMNQDAVYISWGQPSGIRDITGDGVAVEKWRYTRHMPVIRQDIHIGYNYGHHYGYCGPFYEFGPTIEHIPYTAAVVEFRNGKVSSWERERR